MKKSKGKRDVKTNVSIGNKNKNGFFASLFSSRSRKKKSFPKGADVCENPLQNANKVVSKNPVFGRVMLNGVQHSLIQNSSTKNIQQLMNKKMIKKAENRKRLNNVPNLDLSSVKHKFKPFSRKKTKNTFAQQTVKVENPANIININDTTHVNDSVHTNNTQHILRPLPIKQNNKRIIGGSEQKITKYIMQGNGSVNPIAESQKEINKPNGLLKDLIT